MKRSKFKINVGFKKVLASFLTITMLGFQANIMAFATNITGINGNNGVYNINPSSVKGSTGFRHYKDFTLDSGHTANLIFGGINRFVNAVDNQVTINGILNSVNGSGAFANGRAIFVSPKGFVVGSSGVVNVGSLGVYTPSSSAYNSFKNLSVDKMTDALLNGDAYYGNGAITISGMILTREALDIKGSTVKINNTAKIASGIIDKNANTMLSQDNIAKASSAANARNNATTLFNKLVNSGKANFSSDEFNFANNNGNITIAAKSGITLRGTTVANGSYTAKNDTSGNFQSYDTKYVNGNYTLRQSGAGYLDSVGTTRVNGNISITKSNKSWMNVGGLLTNIKEGASTYIANTSAYSSALSITGTIETKGDTSIIQKGGISKSDNRFVKNPYVTRILKSDDIDKALLYIGENAKINVIHDNGGNVANNAKLNIERKASGKKETNDSDLQYYGNIYLSGTNADIEVTDKNSGIEIASGKIEFDQTNGRGGTLRIANNNGGSTFARSLAMGATIIGNGQIDIVNANSGSLNINANITNKTGNVNINNSGSSKIAPDAINIRGKVIAQNGDINVTNSNASRFINIADTLQTNNGNINITQSKSGSGGIKLNGALDSSNNITIKNYGNSGIAFNKNINADGKTSIYDYSTANITIGNTINTNGLEIQNTNKGDVNLNGTINANGDVLVQNNTTGKIDIKGTLNNSATSGTSKIVNESSNTGGINISGKVGAKNATTITNKGNSLINITGDIVDNVNGITIEQTNTGANGGISIAKGITTDGYLTVDNKGQKGITLANGANTKSKGKTTIKDTSNVGINVGAKSTISAGSLEINKSGKGGINLDGTVNSAGDTLVVNSGTDSINIRNSFTGGKTTIYNDVNGKDINITGALTTNGDTMIVQGGNGLLNISKTLNSAGNTTISSINGSGINVGGVNSSGLVLIENGGKGGININGDINVPNYVSIQNQNYKITANKTGNNDSNFIILKREDSDALAKDGGIVANGDISANNILIQNSGSKGIETKGNIGKYGTRDIKIVTDNGGINLKSGRIYGNAITITGANNATGDIKVDTNVNGNIKIENAGKGDIIVNGNLNSSDSSHYVVIENQTYDIVANRASDGEYKVLDVKRYNRNSQNLNGGILANGKIFGGDIYIQNVGAKGITTTNDITGRNIYITNDGGSIDLISGKISSLRDIAISNLSHADGINIGADINANSNNKILSSIVYIANAGKGDLNISGDIFAQTDVMITNQLGTLGTTRVTYDDGFVLNMDYSHGPSVNLDENTGINLSGNINANRLVTVQNAGKKGITMDSNVRAGEFVENESGEIANQGVISVINDNGNINITGGTINGSKVTITNANKGGSLTTKANINASDLVLIENAGKGDMTVDGNITSNKILLENQTYDIVTNIDGVCTNYLEMSRLDAPSTNTNGGLIASGNILGETVYIQNSGVNGITSNANVTSQGNVMITNNNGNINLVSGDISGNNVIVSNSNKAGSLTANANIKATNMALIENAGNGNMTVEGNVEGAIASLQNQTYDIETPRMVAESDGLITLGVKRNNSNSANKGNALVTSGTIKGDTVYVQNSGNKGIETNGNINASQKLMITTDNAGINLKSGNVTGKNVIISASNKATNGITVNANINSEELMLIENAGKGSIIVDGTLNGNNGKVLIENQTYDITTPRTSFNNDYIVLDVKRVDKPAQNVDGGIFANGTISGGNIFIQNAGNKGITTNLDVISQDDVMITNNNGNINLVSGDISGNNVIVSNSNKAGSLTANANIKATNMALIENAGNGNMTVEGNVEGAIASLQNQTYDIETPRMVAESDGLITLGVKRNNSNSANKGNALVTSGTIKGDTVYVQNSGNGGITSNSDIESTGSVFITNNGGALKLESGTINGKDVIISNSNQASNGILVGANVNTKRNGKLVVENAASGSITINGNLNGNGGYVIIENQTYDITTPRTTFNNDYIVLDVNRINNPSQKVDGGIITNGTIAGGDVFIQNAGLKGISINNDVLSDNLMITNDNGGINVGNVNLTAQNRNILISNSSNATGGINIAANVKAEKGDVVVENSGNGNIELKDTSSLIGKRVLVENQTYDITTPRVPEGNYILLGVERNKIASPNNNSGIIANGKITAEDIAYIQNSGKKGISGNGNIKGSDIAITNNGGAINLSSGDIEGNKVIISQSNQGEGGVTIGANVKGDDRVLIENAGKGDITIGGNVNGKKVSIQNQTYDIVTPRNTDDNPYISLDVTRIDQDSPNKDGGIKIDGNVTGTEDNKIQNSGEKGITSSGNIKGGDVAITNNGGAINLSSGDIEGNKVIISQSNQGEGGVTIGANVKGDDRVLIENAGKGDITIGGNVNGKKVSIQNQTYDIVTPRNTDDNPYISLDVTRIDQDSPNKDGGIKIDGNVTGTEDNKIQNSGEKGITSNGEVKGDDVDITNNGGDVNINGKVDGDDVTISNSDNGGDVNINGKVDGNDVLVENNGSGDINNPQNVNGDVKDHEYTIDTPRNTDDNPYISLDVKRGTPFPKPTPEPTPTLVIRDNDPTRLIYDKKRDDSFLELKRESIRYGINGDSLSLNSASNHIQGIVDISKTGLAVKTDGSLKINDEVKVNFAYKGIEVEATAKVMRVNQANNIAGLKFTDLDTLTANKILYLSMLNEAQKEQTASNNQNQQPSFMNVLSKL